MKVLILHINRNPHVKIPDQQQELIQLTATKLGHFKIIKVIFL